MSTVAYDADTSQLDTALKELEPLAILFPEAAKYLVNTFPTFSELVSIDADDAPTAGTSNVRVLFKPSDFLLGYMTALRAFKRQSTISKVVCHT